MFSEGGGYKSRAVCHGARTVLKLSNVPLDYILYLYTANFRTKQNE